MVSIPKIEVEADFSNVEASQKSLAGLAVHRRYAQHKSPQGIYKPRNIADYNEQVPKPAVPFVSLLD